MALQDLENSNLVCSDNLLSNRQVAHIRHFFAAVILGGALILPAQVHAQQTPTSDPCDSVMPQNSRLFGNVYRRSDKLAQCQHLLADANIQARIGTWTSIADQQTAARRAAAAASPEGDFSYSFPSETPQLTTLERIQTMIARLIVERGFRQIDFLRLPRSMRRPPMSGATLPVAERSRRDSEIRTILARLSHNLGARDIGDRLSPNVAEELATVDALFGILTDYVRNAPGRGRHMAVAQIQSLARQLYAEIEVDARSGRY